MTVWRPGRPLSVFESGYAKKGGTAEVKPFVLLTGGRVYFFWSEGLESQRSRGWKLVTGSRNLVLHGSREILGWAQGESRTG